MTGETHLSDQKIAYHLRFSDVIRVLRLLDETHFRELELDLDGVHVRVIQEKESHVFPRPAADQAAFAQPVHSPSAERPAQIAAAPAPVGHAEEDGVAVFAPLAGTFYRAPLPGAPPFVEVGSVVSQGDVVGILEIMKLMNHVTAPCAGVIKEICAGNEEFVEFGHVLAVIAPEPHQ